MLINYVGGIEKHVNPYSIVEACEFDGKFYVVVVGRVSRAFEIDEDSYKRIVAWIDSQ